MAKVMNAGMSRDEILARSDDMRRQVSEYIAGRNHTTIVDIMKEFNVSRDQTRAYLRTLVNNHYIRMIGYRNGSYYVTTGKEYVNMYEPVNTAEPSDNPHARVIRLLDREPEKLTAQERRKRRSSNGGGYMASSMSMFDGW